MLSAPAEVTIKGKSDILNSISAIVIPEDVINVEGANEKFEQRVDLNQYLPAGVSLHKSEEAAVTVKIDIEQLERRVFTVPVRNIGVDDLREGYRIDYNERNVDIEVYGLAEDLDRLTVNALRPVLDVSGLAAGRHVKKLQLTLDNSKYVVGETVVSFTIISEENNNENNTGDHQPAPDEDTSADDNTGTEPDEEQGNNENQDTAADAREGQDTAAEQEDLEDE